MEANGIQFSAVIFEYPIETPGREKIVTTPEFIALSDEGSIC